MTMYTWYNVLLNAFELQINFNFNVDSVLKDDGYK